MAQSLYFRATDATLGTELWRANADGSVGQAADINPGSGRSNPSGFTLFKGELFFSADDGGSRQELWKLKTATSFASPTSTQPGAAPIRPASRRSTMNCISRRTTGPRAPNCTK